MRIGLRLSLATILLSLSFSSISHDLNIEEAKHCFKQSDLIDYKRKQLTEEKEELKRLNLRLTLASLEPEEHKKLREALAVREAQFRDDVAAMFDDIIEVNRDCTNVSVDPEIYEQLCTRVANPWCKSLR